MNMKITQGFCDEAMDEEALDEVVSDEVYVAAVEAMQRRVAAYIRTIHGSDAPVHVRYRVYPTNDAELPLDNLDDVAIQGLVSCEPVIGVDAPLEDPTWLELCEVLNQLLMLPPNGSRDVVYRFFHGVSPVNVEVQGRQQWECHFVTDPE